MALVASIKNHLNKNKGETFIKWPGAENQTRDNCIWDFNLLYGAPALSLSHVAALLTHFYRLLLYN